MEQLLNRKQAAEILGYQPQTLGRYAWLGTGPKFMKIGSRAVRYKRSDLEAWIAANDRSVAQEKPVAASIPDDERTLVSIGPRVVIEGEAYYHERDVIAAFGRLGGMPFMNGQPLVLTWEPK